MNLDALCNAALAALANGAYQGLAVTALAAILVKALPRSNAATRHGIWLVALVLVAALPALHLAVHRDFMAPTNASNPSPILSPDDLPSEPSPSPSPSPSPLDPSRLSTVDDVPVMTSSESIPLPSSAGEPAGDPGTMPESRRVTPSGMPGPTVSAATTAPTEVTGGVSAATMGGFHLPLISLPVPGRLARCLVLGWAGLALVRGFQLLLEYLRLRGWKRNGAAPSESLQPLFDAAVRDMGIRRPVLLRVLPNAGVPMVAGFRTPVVLLPRTFADTAPVDALQALLRHELAHVLRRDDWANLLQQLILVPFHIHPVAAWISRRISLEREIACDDHVLAVAASPRTYALLLTDFAARVRLPALAAAPAAWNQKTQLKERIAMILDTRRNAAPRTARGRATAIATATVLAAGLALVAAPRLAIADTVASATPAVPEPPPAPAATPAPEAVPAPTPVAAPSETRLELVTEFRNDVDDADESRPKSKSRRSATISQSAEWDLKGTPSPALAGHPSAPYTLKGPPTPAGPHAVPAHPPEAGWGRNSIEQRLERLERLVEEIARRDKFRRAESYAGSTGAKRDQELPQPKPGSDFGRIAEEIARSVTEATRNGIDKMELGKIKEKVRKDVEKAMKEAQSQIRGSFDLVMKPDGRAEARAEFDEARTHLDEERRRLEDHKRQLERQIAALERQVAKLKEDQARTEERRVRILLKPDVDVHVDVQPDAKERTEPGEGGDAPKPKTKR